MTEHSARHHRRSSSAGLTPRANRADRLKKRFAAQCSRAEALLPIDPDRLNVIRRRRCARPSARVHRREATTTLLHEMKRRNARYGMVTMCVEALGAAWYIYALTRDRDYGDHDCNVDSARRRVSDPFTYAADVVSLRRSASPRAPADRRTAQSCPTNLPCRSSIASKRDWGLARELVKQVAALGLLGVDVPEAYGGLASTKSRRFSRQRKLADPGPSAPRSAAHANLRSSPPHALLLFSQRGGRS